MITWPPPELAEFAAALPFEHLQRRRSAAEAMARWHCEAQALPLESRRCRVALLLAGEVDPGEAWLRTLASWTLQTWPDAVWVHVGDPAGVPNAALQSAGLPLPAGAMADVSPEALARLGVEWVVPAVSGDLLHPSLAGVIAQAAQDGAGAVAWDWLRAAPGEPLRVLQRRRGPFRDALAELDRDLRGRAFALPARHWRGTPESAWRLRLQLPAAAAAAAWVHPEPLSIQSSEPPSPAADAQLSADLWGVAFDPAGLQPQAAPATVSVIVLYRDRPELTVRAVRSLLAQQMPGRVELILVDNQSGADTRRAIERLLAALPDPFTARVIAHDGPFNHSLQCNRGAEAATGEVLVFLNNDAAFLDPEGLDQMVRWALVPGLASVGARIIEEGRTSGGGFRARRLPGAEFNSPVEEAAGAAGELSRLTVGNTFACAAVAASTFRARGGLDPVRFPVGYNDVDYCLRASRDGWMHLNLATVRVAHAGGMSRIRTDEIAQKLALRQAHPWVATRALQEHEDEPVTLAPVELPSMAARVHGAGIPA